MTRITRAAAHLPAEEVKHRMKHELRPWCRVGWLIIYNALIDPRKAEDIAKHCGVSKATVHHVIPAYNRLGVEVVETPGKGASSCVSEWRGREAVLDPLLRAG